MISVPLEADNSNYQILFPESVEATLFKFGQGYETVQNFIPGVGYWLRFYNSGISFVEGYVVPELALNLMENWNLISGNSTEISVNSIIDPGGIIVPNTFYFFDDGYISGTDLTNGEGYWLRFPNEGFSIITGIPIYDLMINLNEGWNLISGISTILDISEILDPDGIIIPGTLYSFNSGGYFNPGTLEPGNGYWIRANISGTITILVN